MYSQELRKTILESFGVDIYISNQRIKLAENSFTFFCILYLTHYFSLKPAEFHKQLIDILEQEEYSAVGIIGFRGSAKSTFCSFAFPLWCALFKKYNFLILINDTVQQVKLNIANIKAEIEENTRLKCDFPNSFNANVNKWTETELQVGKDVFILGKSRGQKIRGLRFRQWRPQVIIIDDPEDYEWIRQKKNRDKTERWLNTEVIPAQEEFKCKLIIIGNLLHKDALMSRIKKRSNFKIFDFSLIDPKTHEITWKGKYPDMDAINKQKEKVGNNVVWQREYLLQIIAEEEQVVKEEDIHYYKPEVLIETDPSKRLKILDAGGALDLAISEKQTADFTSLVSGLMVSENIIIDLERNTTKGTKVLYIRPNPLNKRLDMSQTINEAQVVGRSLPAGYRLWVEDVAYQKAIIKEMRKLGIPVKEMRPIGDKRARLETASIYIRNGLVKFPEHGCEELIEQLLEFGIAEHDDLCLSGDTIIATSKGDKKLKDIKRGDFVITPFGFRKVLESKMTGYKEIINNVGITGTSDHKVFSYDKGFARLDALVYNENVSRFNIKEQFIWMYKKLLFLMENNTHSWAGKESIILVAQQQIVGEKVLKDFMWRFGNFIIKRKFLSAMKFTIKMATLLIMILKIWNVYRYQNIVNYIKIIEQNYKEQKKKNIYQKLDHLHQSGTSQNRVESGTRNELKNNGIIQKGLREYVKYVATNFMDFKSKLNFVVKNAYTKTTSKNTQIKSENIIKDLVKKENVYNLTIEHDNCYYANGILVGNCDALVYLILGMFSKKQATVGEGHDNF